MFMKKDSPLSIRFSPLRIPPLPPPVLELVDIETAVRALLDDNGIIANMRVMYLNFARALYRAKGHNSGLALRKIATAEKAKFVQYGLDPDILDAIIEIVIGTTAY